MRSPRPNGWGGFTPVSRSPTPTAADADRDLNAAVDAAHHGHGMTEEEQQEDADLWTCRKSLDVRKTQFEQAEEAKSQKQPYRWPRPWPLEMRARCTQFPLMLDEYYRLEKLIGERMEHSMLHDKAMDAYFDGGELRFGIGRDEIHMHADWRTRRKLAEIRSKVALVPGAKPRDGFDASDEGNMLRELNRTRCKDVEEGNDARVLHRVLDALEARLDDDIAMHDDGVATQPGVRITDPPPNLRDMMYKMEDTLERLDALRTRERVAFPNRYANEVYRLQEEEEEKGIC